TQVTSPSAGVAGQRITVAWTVTNTGDASAQPNWIDRVYLSASGTLSGATFLGALTRTQALAAGSSYSASLDVTLPDLADGTYQVLVFTDATDTVFESTHDANNLLAAANTLTLHHADLRSTFLAAPASALTGDTVVIEWSTLNAGTGTTVAGWVDRVYLSADQQLSGSDRLLGARTFGGPLNPGEAASGLLTVTLPLDVTGNLYLLLVTDATNQVRELGGEADNLVTRPIAITLAPYADLAVRHV